MNEQAKSLVNRTQFLKANSATKDEVAELAGGNYSFETYDLMDAAKTSLSENSTITILDDPDPSKNGPWGWDGSNFTKSKYDPVKLLQEFFSKNPLVTPVILSSENLNNIKKTGIYIARNGTPSTENSYPPGNEPGVFVPYEIVTGSTGTLIPQFYLTFSGKLFIRGTDGSGITYSLWEQIGTKSLVETWANAVNPFIQPLNTISHNGRYSVYSTDDVLITNHPEAGIQWIIDHFEIGNVKRQIAYDRASNRVETRSHWGTNGWTTWERLILASELNNYKEEVQNIIKLNINPLEAFKTSLINKLNSFDSLIFKLIGDSITWGMGVSNISPTDPRTGYLTDPRNKMDPISPTWANLYLQYLAYAFGDRSITEDAPGRAYTKRNRIISFKQDIDKFVFKTNKGTFVPKSTVLETISTQPSKNGEAINLLGLNFQSLRQNEFSFEITSDNISIIYQKWNIGDINDIVEVYIDETLVGTFNYYSETSSYENTFSTTFEYGKHKVRVKNIATNVNSYAHIQCCQTIQKIWLINEGISGSSTLTWLDRKLFEDTITEYDDFVLMMLGTNDRGTAGGESGFETRLNTCIDKIKILSNSKARICLATSAHASLSNESNPVYAFKMRIVDQVISKVAEQRKLPHISHYKYTSTAMIENQPIFTSPDLLHPNDLGNKLIYENLRNTLFIN